MKFSIKIKKEVEEILSIDDYIWNKYKMPEGSAYPHDQMQNEWYACQWLENSLESLMTAKHDAEQLLQEYESIKCKVSSSTQKILEKYLDFSRAKRAAEIRSDWADALRHVKEGCDLSGWIGYGLTKGDITNLAKLHKARKFRRKIEDLLTDCNFHYECGCFSSGEYDEFLIVKEGA